VSRRPGYDRPDAHTRAAKAAGYPARSIFKLEEIDRRYRVFRSGQRVLDLGAAPGSWTLYAAGKVGPAGRVLAVDLNPLNVALPANVRALQGDVFALSEAELGGLYQVVMSDMAPHTSGSKVRDQALSLELCQRALALADQAGAQGSHFIAKMFMNADYPEFKRAVSERYNEVRLVRPEATRAQSTEVFVVGLGRKATPPLPPAGPAASTPAPAVPTPPAVPTG
jgi:23S rRNA (uridine2552-2'-O)-methyltransferase